MHTRTNLKKRIVTGPELLKNKMAKILDTTLRDGSYVVNFQFTAKDTALIAAKLDDAKIPFIELGHGWGMNAGTRENSRSAEPDEAHLEAAKATVKNGKWGMFFIPGIGRMQDLELAAKHGMDFIRIGTNVTEVEQSEKFIRRAKELGLYVFANYMKAYAISPEELGMMAQKSAGYGADIITIVDSAGGMMPEDVEAYFREIKKCTSIPVGFHGHNNLGMAIANSLKAAEMGAAIVDTSIRGMGRSSGNATTEIFLLALKRKGIDHQADVSKLLDLAEKIIDPLLKNHQAVDSYGILSGYAQFHSSFLSQIVKYAEQYKVDAKELMIRVSKEDKINATDELIERISKELAKEMPGIIHKISVDLPFESKASKSPMKLGEKATFIAEQTQSLAGKWGNIGVLNIVQGFRRGHSGFVSNAIHEGKNYMVSNAEVYTPEEAVEISLLIDGKIDFVLLDIDHKTSQSSKIISGVRSSLVKTKILEYSDVEVWSRSISHLLIYRMKEFIGKKILIIGKNSLGNYLMNQLLQLGAEVASIGSDVLNMNVTDSSAIVLCEEVVPEFQLAGLKDQIIIDGWIGSFGKKLAEDIHRRSLKVYRPEMNIFIHAEIQAGIGCAQLISERQGVKTIGDLLIASGGIIVPEGSVIVDSIKRPAKVFGIADGRGFLIQSASLTDEHLERIKKVEKLITDSILN